jgi:hypothetical protein
MSGDPELLESALSAYKERMLADTRTFWTKKIQSLDNEASLTDKQRLDQLASCKGIAWNHTYDGALLTTPAQLLLPPEHPDYLDLGLNSDGVMPPKPLAARTNYLDHLSRLITEVAGSDLPLPAEFLRFLELADAVYIPLSIDHPPCGINGTDLGNAPSRNSMSDYASEQRDWYDQGWTVRAGWRAALGEEAATHVLYAKKDTGTPSEVEWKWRVFSWDRDCYDGRWFDTIAQFIEFNASWVSKTLFDKDFDVVSTDSSAFQLERLPPDWEDHRQGPLGPEAADWESEEDDEEDEDEGDSDRE